jgi:hypothetical protein
MDNQTLPQPKRAFNQTPRGIGQLPEQTFRNTSHIGDDKAQAIKIGRASVYRLLAE